VTLTGGQILAGLGLTVALAVGSQLVARWLRLPALVLLLPVGFLAGALTKVVEPANLLGPLFQPLVSLAVAVVLFESGLGLDLKGLEGHGRRVVRRLVIVGIPITWALAASFTILLLGLSKEAAFMIGAILVVSGPTVVGPLLASAGVRRRVRTILTWEGSIIDPIGAIFGALVFHAIVASGQHHGLVFQLGQFLASVGVGVAGGVVGSLLLWFLLRRTSLTEVMGTQAALGTVVAVAAACDILRDDTGLIAAIVIGMALANLPGFDLPERRPFFETVIQLTIGLLFVSISASVAPASVRHLVLPALALVAVLVLAGRPLVAFLSTLGTDLSWRERSFIGWMAPRGIVAAATASAFTPALLTAGVPGASDILPVTFIVIVATVTIYALTARPVARRLGLRSGRHPFSLPRSRGRAGEGDDQ
jgi:NhaP-type Na+/H+ or K+/H+ antiporter